MKHAHRAAASLFARACATVRRDPAANLDANAAWLWKTVRIVQMQDARDHEVVYA
jgi:hypothetical protein